MVKPIPWLLAVTLAFATSTAAHSQDAAQRPNIVFILADDLGINDLGCYGRKEHKTPNIDKLAEQGIRFTSAYSAQLENNATEAAILTGQSIAWLKSAAPNGGLGWRGAGDCVARLLLQPESNEARDSVLVKGLNETGYITASIRPVGFSYVLASPFDQRKEKPEKVDIAPHPMDLAERFTDGRKDQPFFLFVRFDHPLYAGKPVNTSGPIHLEPPNLFDHAYAGKIEILDAGVGRLMAKLGALKIAENTIVILTSGSGGCHVSLLAGRPTHNTPYRAGNGFLYEGGVRIPLIVRWPARAKAATVNASAVMSTDWTPTLLAAAGVVAKEKSEGVNFLEAITEGKPLPPRTLCWHFPYYSKNGGRPSGAIREGAWKLIEHYENGACELYNLELDVGETKDLAEKAPSRVADLRGKLEKWRRDFGAAGNRPNPDFNPTHWKELYGDIDISRIGADFDRSSADKKLFAWADKMSQFERQALKKADRPPQPGAGAVFLFAKDAKVHGDKLRHEPQPQKDTLGYWVNQKDWLEWTFTPPHKGVFEVQLLQACGKGSGGADIELSVAGQTLMMKVEDTGHFQRIVPRTIGTVKLNEGEPVTLAVRATTKPGPAVMDLRRVVLRAAP